MRIEGYIEHPDLKITIFQMNNRFSVKIESGLYEQTYKFRSLEHIQSVEDVKKIITPEFLVKAEAILKEMHRLKLDGLENAFPGDEQEVFPEII